MLCRLVHHSSTRAINSTTRRIAAVYGCHTPAIIATSSSIPNVVTTPSSSSSIRVAPLSSLATSTSASSRQHSNSNNSGNHDGHNEQQTSRHGWRRATAAAATGVIGAAITISWSVGAAAPTKDETGMYKEGLPMYTREEVAKHKTAATGIWVTYKSGVYDITKFVAEHPGGSKRIMLAAGAAIDPFWGMYQQHQTPEVKHILEPMRIGNLEGGAPAAPSGPPVDPYKNEPVRNPAYIIQTAKPFNAEPPAEALIPYITPNEFFFKRNHLPVPVVDPATYRLIIDGEGVRYVSLSLEDLRTRFPRYTVTATLQCAGNRRGELQTLRPIKGLEWKSGAISTATWSGVRLRDVLYYCGLNESDLKGVKHVQFEGLDNDGAGTNYGSSIHVDKAMAANGDVLLAWEMNGEPLPRDHGYPLRAIVPGVVGARHVKWLAKIRPSSIESQAHWQQNDYKGFNSSVDWHNVNWKSSPAIQEMPVTSAILEPATGDQLDDDIDEVVVKGYAWSGGGRDIVRVDVSADGKEWTTAELLRAPTYSDQRHGAAWAWTPWQATVKIPAVAAGVVIPATGRKITLSAKATDEHYNGQPSDLESNWNLRGVLNNVWSRADITLAPKKK